MEKTIRKYLSDIGRQGGMKSRRELTSEAARQMVAVREARRAFRRFQTQCFWSYRKDLEIGVGDIEWVAGELMKHGNREAWLKGRSLCR